MSLAPLLLACALLCAGCAAAVYEVPPLLKIVKETQHANGLVVGVPEGFEVRQQGDALVVEPSGDANREVRFPVSTFISLEKGDRTSRESPFQTKSVGGKEVHYRVRKSEGGSGGEIYVLEVYEHVEGGQIWYSQAAQSETNSPDFSLCWTLVGSTKYQKQ